MQNLSLKYVFSIAQYYGRNITITQYLDIMEDVSQLTKEDQKNFHAMYYMLIKSNWSGEGR